MDNEVRIAKAEIQEFSKIDEALAKLKAKYADRVFDVTTFKGMNSAKVARRDLVKQRTLTEQVRKALKAPVLERGKLIDSEAKRITAAIAEVEGPIDAMIKAEEERKAEIKRLEEEKELARVRSIQAGITDINSMWARCVGVGSEHILKLLDALEAEEIGEFYAEFAEQARAAKDEAIVRVKRILAEAQEREDEEREELRLREEREAVRRVEEEKLKAEREALAKQKAAQDAKERELAEKEAKQEAERRRVEEEAAEAELMRLLDEQKAEEELAGPPTFSKPSKKEIPDCLLLDRVQMEIEKAFECGFVAGLMASKSGNEHDAGRLSSEYLSDLLSGEVL